MTERSSPSLLTKIASMSLKLPPLTWTRSPGENGAAAMVCGWARRCRNCSISSSRTGVGWPPKLTTRLTPRVERIGYQLS